MPQQLQSFLSARNRPVPGEEVDPRTGDRRTVADITSRAREQIGEVMVPGRGPVREGGLPPLPPSPYPFHQAPTPGPGFDRALRGLQQVAPSQAPFISDVQFGPSTLQSGPIDRSTFPKGTLGEVAMTDRGPSTVMVNPELMLTEDPNIGGVLGHELRHLVAAEEAYRPRSRMESIPLVGDAIKGVRRLSSFARDHDQAYPTGIAVDRALRALQSVR